MYSVEHLLRQEPPLELNGNQVDVRTPSDYWICSSQALIIEGKSEVDLLDTELFENLLGTDLVLG